MNNLQRLTKDFDLIISDINEGLANTLVEDGKVAAEYKEILKTNLTLNVISNKDKLEEKLTDVKYFLGFDVPFNPKYNRLQKEITDNDLKDLLELYAIQLAKGLLGGLGIEYNTNDILSATDFIWDWEPLMV